MLEDDQSEEEKESLDKCCWLHSIILPWVLFLIREAEWSANREGKKEWLGPPEGENTSYSHLIACQSAKLQKAPSMLLFQQNVVRELLGELHLCSLELGGHRMRCCLLPGKG